LRNPPKGGYFGKTYQKTKYLNALRSRRKSNFAGAKNKKDPAVVPGLSIDLVLWGEINRLFRDLSMFCSQTVSMLSLSSFNVGMGT